MLSLLLSFLLNRLSLQPIYCIPTLSTLFIGIKVVIFNILLLLLEYLFVGNCQFNHGLIGRFFRLLLLDVVPDPLKRLQL
jgi:hypothetical protein